MRISFTWFLGCVLVLKTERPGNGKERQMKRTGAVVVAAGMSSRMGDFKPLLPFGGSTIAGHIIGMLKNAGVGPIAVVIGYRGEELAAALSHAGVRFVKNRRYQASQMLDSVKMGLQEIDGECDRMLVMPVDVPGLSEETIRRAIAIDSEVVRTVCGGRSGHPVVMSREMARKVGQYQGENGLKGAIESLGIQVTDLEVHDEGIFMDVDTRDEYERLLAWNRERGRGGRIRPVVQLKLAAEDVFFGPETEDFFYILGQCGSIQETAVRMGLSYSKGCKMIKCAERQLGISLAERHSGGSGGGGSELTEAGKRFLASYRELRRELQADAEKLFRKYFEESPEIGKEGGGDSPDAARCREIWDACGVPEQVRRHQEAVCKKALALAAEVGPSCAGLDIRLIEAAALLHDIGKGQERHAARGAEILGQMGYPKLAGIVACHHDLGVLPKRPDEKVIVYLADKLVQGDREVTLEERFRKSGEKCAWDQDAADAHTRRYREAVLAWKLWQSCRKKEGPHGEI